VLELIRDIRASERRFYQKVLDIYATSVDYQPGSEYSQQFFATVQNKMHWATQGHTAAEIIAERANGTKPSMGMLFSPKTGPWTLRQCASFWTSSRGRSVSVPFRIGSGAIGASVPVCRREAEGIIVFTPRREIGMSRCR